MDLTLDGLLSPAIIGYVPEGFGHVIEKDDVNKGGLSTKQVNANVRMPFTTQRAATVSQNESTGRIEYNATVIIVAAGVTLTIDAPVFDGCLFTVYNGSGGAAKINANGANYALQARQKSTLIAYGGKWVGADCPINFVYTQFKGQPAPSDLYPCTAWSNVSSSYAGRFFRAEGGAAAAFGSDQGEGLPNITGEIQVGGAEYQLMDGSIASRGSGAFTAKPTSGYGRGHENGQMPIFNFNASRSSSLYGANSHVTPVNSTVRIWKRTG